MGKHKKLDQEQYDKELLNIRTSMRPYVASLSKTDIPPNLYEVGDKVWTARDCNSCDDAYKTQIIEVIITGRHLVLPMNQDDVLYKQFRNTIEWQYDTRVLVYHEKPSDALLKTTHGMGFLYTLTIPESLLGKSKAEVRELVALAELKGIQEWQEKLKHKEAALKQELGIQNEQ